MFKVGYVKSTALPGDRLTVYFDDGTSGTFTAETEITSTNVLVTEDRVFSGDASRPQLTETNYRRAKTNYEDDEQPTVVSLWQRFTQKAGLIPYVNPRWQYSSFEDAYYIDSRGDGYPTLEEAINNYGVITFIGNPSRSHKDAIAKTDNPNFAGQPAPNGAFYVSTYGDFVAEVNEINAVDYLYDYLGLDANSPGDLFSRRRYREIKLTLNFVIIYRKGAADNFAVLESATIDYNLSNYPSLTINGLEGYVLVEENEASRTYRRYFEPNEPELPIQIGWTIDVPPSEVDGYPLAIANISFTVSTRYFFDNVVWNQAGRNVEWWLQFNSTGNQIKVLECDRYETMRCYLTAANNKAYFVAKLGKAIDPNSNLSNSSANREWQRIVALEVSATGEIISNQTFNNPEPITAPTEEENWQQWAYSYIDINSDVSPDYPGCGKSTSTGTRRSRAGQRDFVGSSFDPKTSTDRGFKGETVVNTISFFALFDENGLFYESKNNFEVQPLPQSLVQPIIDEYS